MVRKCEVSVTDTRNFTHRVTVHTSSVMQAAGRGLQVFEEDDLLEGCDLTTFRRKNSD